MYVEIFDRVSARRLATNTFFLTLNSAVITVIGIFWKGGSVASPWLLLPALIIALGQCFAWHQLVRGYCELNRSKYAVIGAIEDFYPRARLWRAEVAASRTGSDRGGYWPVIIRRGLDIRAVRLGVGLRIRHGHRPLKLRPLVVTPSHAARDRYRQPLIGASHAQMSPTAATSASGMRAVHTTLLHLKSFR
jgi:hypothetical protein